MVPVNLCNEYSDIQNITLLLIKSWTFWYGTAFYHHMLEL